MKFGTRYHELQNSTGKIRVLLLDVTQEDAQVKPSSESGSILEVVCQWNRDAQGSKTSQSHIRSNMQLTGK